MKYIINIKYFQLLLFVFFSLKGYTQNTNLTNLITASQWNLLFPNRAGTSPGHPQGYTTDFYSYSNFNQAVNEMSDYLVNIRLKNGVWGQLITVTRKSNGNTYIYSDVDSWWYSNPTPETVIDVDFADFINRYSSQNNKRELAALLANISKETTGGWQLPVGGGAYGDYANWGLYYVHELGYNSSNGAGTYSQPHVEYPPNPLKGYYGRGPIQLSWNYNYGQLSKFLYNDKNILLNNPDSVQMNGVLAFKSAIWFWMMPQCPKPSCHQVMHDLWEPQPGDYPAGKMYNKGFAHTNNIINGGLECRSASSPAFTQKVVIRSELYQYYLGIMGFNSTQIAMEDSNNYSTLCYESASNAMNDYINCFVNSNPLPVELKSFYGYSENGKNILKWETASPVNISHFEVERRNNGLQFDALGTVEIHPGGNYSFIDSSLSEELLSFYRLKSMDFDGKYTFSGVISVLNQKAESKLKLYPNPAGNDVSLGFSNSEWAGQKNVWNIVITNLQGVKVLEMAIDKQQNSVFVGNLPEGLYLWEVKSENVKEFGKLMIQR